jgi:hypothetical protein
VQYGLVGIGSGFFAHVLATIVVCWRRMLRAAAVAGILAALAAELAAFAFSHEFPPSAPANIVAAALGLALAYGVAGTVFIAELIQGALRTMHLLGGAVAPQAEASPVVPASIPTSIPTSIPPMMPAALPAIAAIPGTSGVTPVPFAPVPFAPSQPRPVTPSAPRVSAVSPMAPTVASDPVTQTAAFGALAGFGEPSDVTRPRPGRVVAAHTPAPHVPLSAASPQASGVNEYAPTQPFTLAEEDTATVLLLPETPVYVPGVGLTEAGSDIPPPLPDRYALLRRYAPNSLVPPLAPAPSPMSPLPDNSLVPAGAPRVNAAPAGGRRMGRFGLQRLRRS